MPALSLPHGPTEREPPLTPAEDLRSSPIAPADTDWLVPLALPGRLWSMGAKRSGAVGDRVGILVWSFWLPGAGCCELGGESLALASLGWGQLKQGEGIVGKGLRAQLSTRADGLVAHSGVTWLQVGQVPGLS